MKDKAIDEAYEALEHHIGEPPPPKAWEIAIRKRHVVEYVQGETDLETLAAQVDDLADTLRKADQLKRSQQESKDITEPPNHRRWALNEIFALEATGAEDVEGFRTTWLPGGLIDLENVADWITYRKESEGPPSTWITSLASDDGAPVHDADQQPGFRESLETLQYVEADHEWVQTVMVNAHGALFELKVVAHRLTRRYDWSEAWAATFVLTGRKPPPIRASYTETKRWPWYRARRGLTIRVRLDVQPRQVMEIYRAKRNRMLEGEPRPRAIGELKAQLGVFAAAHNEGFSWREAMRKWNRENPQHSFDDEARFTRDCRDAFVRITGEQLHWAGKTSIEGEH